jgi:hypothetical protein
MAPQVTNAQLQLRIVNIKRSKMILSHCMYRLGHSYKKTNISIHRRIQYRGADKSLARPRRKQAIATEDFDVHISYLLL